jgi:DNA invertase Pin-like site-specific DNA recombinase
MSTLRYALYVRVSTASKACPGEATNIDQDPEAQEQPLREFITQRGGELFKIFFDCASVEKERRPGLDALIADARRREFDVIVVWSFDRFAPGVKQLILALEEFRVLGIGFVSYKERVDTTTPIGKAMLKMIAAMAELEHSIVREKPVIGVRHATGTGKSIGRPKAIFSLSN